MVNYNFFYFLKCKEANIPAINDYDWLKNKVNETENLFFDTKNGRLEYIYLEALNDIIDKDQISNDSDAKHDLFDFLKENKDLIINKYYSQDKFLRYLDFLQNILKENVFEDNYFTNFLIKENLSITEKQKHPIYLFKKDNLLISTLNRVFRTADLKGIFYMRYFIFHLNNALHKIPKDNHVLPKILFRNTHLTEEELSVLKESINKEVLLRGFNIFSDNMESVLTFLEFEFKKDFHNIFIELDLSSISDETAKNFIYPINKYLHVNIDTKFLINNRTLLKPTEIKENEKILKGDSYIYYTKIKFKLLIDKTNVLQKFSSQEKSLKKELSFLITEAQSEYPYFYLLTLLDKSQKVHEMELILKKINPLGKNKEKILAVKFFFYGYVQINKKKYQEAYEFFLDSFDIYKRMGETNKCKEISIILNQLKQKL